MFQLGLKPAAGLLAASLLATVLTACAGAPGQPQQVRMPGQGQYIYPQRLRPQPMPSLQPADICGARLYQGLVGQNIGSVHLPVIAGDKRIIRPAEVELSEADFLPDLNPQPPLLEVREMLAGQPLYAASIRTGLYPGQIGPEREDRLTFELDSAGYILTAACG